METSLVSRIVWAAIAGLAAYATIIFGIEAGYSLAGRAALVVIVIIAVAALRAVISTFMERGKD